MNTFLWSCCLALVLAGKQAPCSVGRSLRITGGEQATEHEFPFLISLRTKDGKHNCGGSLIAPNWVLTAAHCVSASPQGMTVRTGLHKVNARDGCVETFGVLEVYKHRDYKGSHMRNDIALLKLDGDSLYAPIPLNAQAGTDPKLERAGETVTVAGWGALAGGRDPDYPTYLQKVDLAVVEQTKCDRQWDGEVTDRMICAAEKSGGKDACFGDSGGPLFTDKGGSFVQVGLVSYGEGCGQKNGAPGVYTRVRAYQDWIQRQMETDESQNSGGFGNGSGGFKFSSPAHTPRWKQRWPQRGERGGTNMRWQKLNARLEDFGRGSGGASGFGQGSGAPRAAAYGDTDPYDNKQKQHEWTGASDEGLFQDQFGADGDEVVPWEGDIKSDSSQSR